jgi:branched-chain amino acid transport system substrate-binding protein
VVRGLKHDILLVSGSASVPEITDLEDNQLLWRTIPSDALQALLGARHLLTTKGLLRTAIIYRDDAWGRGLADAFSAAYAAGGGTVVARVSYDVSDPNPDALLSRNYSPKLDQVFADLPEAVYLLNFTEVFAITNETVSGGYLAAYSTGGQPFLGSDGIYSEDIVTNVPSTILQRLSTLRPRPGRRRTRRPQQCRRQTL